MIKLRNANGYGPYSDPYELIIYNNQVTSQQESTSAPIDPLLLPSKPRILASLYDKLNGNFYLKWLLDNTGGSELEELNVTFLEYGSGPVKTFFKSNYYYIF